MKIVFLNIKRINYDEFINLDNFPNTVFYDETKEEEILERIDGFDVIVVKELPLKKEVIDSFPCSVKLICEAGTGYNNIDILAARRKGIDVCNVPSYATDTVAAYTMMLLLNLSTSFKQNELMIFNNDFTNFTNHLTNSYVSIQDKVLGIVGYGAIGKKVAKIASCMGMKVICYTRKKHENTETIKFVTLDELLKTSDFISLHCPLNNDSYHMINKSNIELIKDGAYLINTARGALIEESVLVRALENGKLAGAALDVLEVEPCRKDNPLLDMNNVIITPHMAWNSKESRLKLINEVYGNIQNYEKNEDFNLVN